MEPETPGPEYVNSPAAFSYYVILYYQRVSFTLVVVVYARLHTVEDKNLNLLVSMIGFRTSDLNLSKIITNFVLSEPRNLEVEQMIRNSKPSEHDTYMQW